ncbi:MAG: Glycosyl transferase group 1 [Berkelbacteria bacterium GW2011_GWA1_36_9]|uniref:Glycosyl transferase group 1 n=1 Tax=Berkelbacteria bacterium GW2011_GWA1_36_9 TaxID=1618331 RepID=A0A0G0FHD8_9BACT|nr:MAG: Glycosyl transferase group 1 [Berkelbacteria bacterium GW2011_GWA1_36_9]
MNIGIDANCLIFEKAGVGKYTQNIVKNLIKIDRKNHYFLYFSFLRYRKKREKIIKDFLKPKTKNVTYKILPIPTSWYEFLTTTKFPITRLINDKIDVYFAPYVSGIPKNGFPKTVATVHDLVFLRFPEHRGKKLTNYYLKRHIIATSNAQKIIAPSVATKNDLQEFLKIESEKIQVIPEAADSRFRKIKNDAFSDRVISRYFDPKLKYILSVGTLEPRKNLTRLVTAYSLLPHILKREYKLVLVGAKGWNNSELYRAIKNLNLEDNVIFLGFVSDEDLPYIYNRANIFVYPALYEGFGLPPLEAMASGVPVIVSANSSLPEVVGNAAILLDVKNEEEIAQAIKEVILKEKLRQKLVKRGFEQAKKFSWATAAKETLKVLEEVGKRRD